MKRNWLKYKRVLIVDDEPDVLDTLEELLSMCEVVRAPNFDEAKDLLETQYFDIAVLDIMGVNGYKLLEIAVNKKVMAVMLTAHALSPEDTAKSYHAGAAHYVPKEMTADIVTYLNDMIEAEEQGKSLWWRWLDRFGVYYDEKFGPDWKDKDKDFWKKLSASE